MEFPSPFGVILFQINQIFFFHFLLSVSVPFRGYLISNIIGR